MTKVRSTFLIAAVVATFTLVVAPTALTMPKLAPA